MAEQHYTFVKICKNRDDVLREFGLPNGHLTGWPFCDSEPNMMDGAGPIRPDAFDEPSPEAKATWERNVRPIIDEIARVRADG